MTDPTDRVAKALLARDCVRDYGFEPAGSELDRIWASIGESGRTAYRLDAVAAMGALRPGDELGENVVAPKEPTEAMLYAGDAPEFKSDPCAGDDVEAVYRAMIAASGD